MALSQLPGSTPAGGPSRMAVPPESVIPCDFRQSDRPPCADGAAGAAGVVADVGVVDAAAGAVVAADGRSGSGVDTFGEHALSSTVAATAATVGMRVIR